MIQIPQEDHKKSVPSSQPRTEATPNDEQQARPARTMGSLVALLRRFPLPFGVIALLLVSLVSWLAGWHEVSQWSLIVVILLGGVPLLWETIRQLLRREVGVDVIAILAIGGSLVLERGPRCPSSLGGFGPKGARGNVTFRGRERVACPA